MWRPYIYLTQKPGEISTYWLYDTLPTVDNLETINMLIKGEQKVNYLSSVSLTDKEGTKVWSPYQCCISVFVLMSSGTHCWSWWLGICPFYASGKMCLTPSIPLSTVWGCGLVLEHQGMSGLPAEAGPCCLYLQSAESCYFCKQSWAGSTKVNKSIPPEFCCMIFFFRSDPLAYFTSSIFLLSLLEWVLSCCKHLAV